jgi:hypothetical protein
VAEISPTLHRPRGEDLRGSDGLARHHQHALAVERATFARHLGHVTERDRPRQREADLGGPQAATAHLVGPPRGDDLAVAHHGHPVGEVLGLVHVVRGQEHGLAQLAQRPDRRPCLAAGRRIKPGGGLVKEDQVGIAHQGERQVQAPALASGQMLGAHIAISGELDELDDLVDRQLANVVPAVHLHQLGDRQIDLHAALLQHDAHLLAQLAAAAGGVDPQDPGLTAGAGAVALQDLDDRRLAGSVGTQQAEHLAPCDLEAHPAHRLRLAIRAPEVAHLDGGALNMKLCRTRTHAGQRKLGRALS